MRILDTILNIIFPVNCIVCEKSGEDLCMLCLSDFPSAERETSSWVFPIFDYRDKNVKKAIWMLKYKGKKRLADIFGIVMYGRILEELGELDLMANFKKPILIPIPLSKTRQKERGYNQTELICRKIMNLGEKNLEYQKNVLIKIRETEHQARIEDKRKRLLNLIDSFGVINEELIKGRNIILLDDVTTTGTTLKEAKKVLKNAGAKKIIAFTLAH
ncbi:hypothetical protein A2914_01235 [Candidatus Nomurabacteria bacterium RIFCSPLOWO2_01_FULL_41_21]|uniref:Phosphoribosyltransferase domain-containing protein n=2 Tax=Candidatus Nomuraibacteriota TaxID=1752729 RepID=A0A1F6V1Y5_9BACT|nr:MAG: hypothetical protein A2733_02325 [Candidatus Nomurabacteria bacterium RIFCSPHIGHO2_01_FULL_40_20]OGI87935.1 MAG: hypothetical protein A2914_01235 [Candidatus Nomurabacteria bacterium RIFCSPLOWO2_01_FULL_41_21]